MLNDKDLQKAYRVTQAMLKMVKLDIAELKKAYGSQCRIFIIKLASPARRAIQSTGAKTLEDLAAYSKTEIANLHGIGPNAMNSIVEIFNKFGLSLKQ